MQWKGAGRGGMLVGGSIRRGVRRNGAHNGGVPAYKAATKETPQSLIWQLAGFTSAFKVAPTVVVRLID